MFKIHISPAEVSVEMQSKQLNQLMSQKQITGNGLCCLSYPGWHFQSHTLILQHLSVAPELCSSAVQVR